MGINSTPIFLSYKPEKYVGVENDSNWLDYLKGLYDFKDHSILLHDLGPDVGIATQYKDIKTTEEIKAYYAELSKLVTGSPRLLFVDQFTGARCISIMELGRGFDIIIYHDCEPKGLPVYNYYFPDEFTSLFNSYVLKNGTVWTGCFLKKGLTFNKDLIQPFIDDYYKKNELKPWRHFILLEDG